MADSPPGKVRVLAAALTVSAGLLVSTAYKEGYRDRAYPDPATRGAPWTLGFGETKGVKPGDRTTPLQAMAQLKTSLDGYAAGVASCIHVPLSQGEFDSSVDLAYNLGVGGFCASSIATRFNESDYWGACMAVLLYTKARVDGRLVVMPGLVARRWDEYNTCIGG